MRTRSHFDQKLLHRKFRASLLLYYPAMTGISIKSASRGYTMTELVVVMTIVGILAAIGIPSFKTFTSTNRVAGELNSLLGDIQYARSESIKEGLPVTICASANAASANPTCDGAGSTTWNTGWIVFSDVTGNKVVDNGVDTVLRAQPAFSGTDTLSSDNAVNAIVFNREGFGTTGVANTVTLTLHATPVNSTSTRCLTVSPVGMIATLRYTAGSCI